VLDSRGSGSAACSRPIVANNSAADLNGQDMVAWTFGVVSPNHGDVVTGQALELEYSLVADSTGFTVSGTGNLFNQDPLLDSLADNGGPTLSHQPQAGIPALEE